MIALVARSKNGVLGNDGKLPWHCPEDLKFFKKMTLSRSIVVGRVTFDGLPELKERRVLVLSRSHKVDLSRKAAFVRLERIPEDAVICGGSEIYNLLIPKCEKVFVTTINVKCDGDVFFKDQWLNGFVIDSVIEKNDKYSIICYKNKGK